MQVENMNLEQAVAELRKLPKLCASMGSRGEMPEDAYREKLIRQVERWTQDKNYIAMRNRCIPAAENAAYGLEGTAYCRVFLGHMDLLYERAKREIRNR